MLYLFRSSSKETVNKGQVAVKVNFMFYLGNASFKVSVCCVVFFVNDRENLCDFLYIFILHVKIHATS